MTTHEQIIAAAKNSRLEALFIKDANGKVWRVIDLALPELERFYAIAFEAGRVAEREETNRRPLPDNTAPYIRARGESK